MDDQASVRASNGAHATGVVGSLSDFGNDVATLAELQLKLAALDARETAQRAAVPFNLAVGGIALAFAALPVILFGLAELLARAFQIPEGWALLIVGLAALILGMAVALVASRRLTASFDSFRRTGEELSRNVTWIRNVLLRGNRAAAPKR